jgi:hypothetical protein
LWCGLFFLSLVVENVVLFIDREILVQTDLSGLRHGAAVVGTLVLLYGLIWDAQR